MEQFIIRGGKQIAGSISVNGAKNHALKVLPASLLFAKPVVIRNVPMVEDVLRMMDIIRAIGGTVNVNGSTVEVHPPESFDGDLPVELVPTLRASLLLIGPLLTRFGRVCLPHPGGDNIGKRPIDFFLDFASTMGATVEEKENTIVFTASEGLKGAEYFFPLQSHTGTETMILAASGAQGTTTIYNASSEPEVIALVNWLRNSGVEISGEGTNTIHVTGAARLEALTPAEAVVIPDRIEAGSFLILGACANATLTVTDCEPQNLRSLIHTFALMGIETTVTENAITVLPHGQLKPVSIVTHESPGFPTDLQAPMTVLLTQANGESEMRETIYEGRLFYTDLLNTMGADIELLDAYRAQIHGPSQLRAALVHSPDIRAGIALVIAAIIGEGTTTINEIYQIDRGYANLEERLQAIGVDIKRVNTVL